MQESLVGKNLLGYYIKKELKGGGMSKVFLASPADENTTFKNDVIIKVISKESIAAVNKEHKATDGQWNKAIDEFKITWQIFSKPHDNIAKPIKWKLDSNNDIVYIITEYVDGPSLSQYISKQKALKIDRAMFYFKSICEGVKHFHQIHKNRVIIHRDLKSDNIMLSKDLREIKIIDYGIATSFYDNVFESSEGTIYCTANYTTPDILKLTPTIINGALKGDKKYQKEMSNIITVQFDFHALGVILYEMLNGSFPFHEKNKESDREKIDKWRKFDLPILSNKIINIPTSIDNIIFRLTASKPEDLKYRYNNIDELMQDLATWDSPERKNEPLLKPIEKRVLESPNIFEIDNLKANEPFYTKWWFFVVINGVAALVLIVAIIIIILVSIGKI